MPTRGNYHGSSFFLFWIFSFHHRGKSMPCTYSGLSVTRRSRKSCRKPCHIKLSTNENNYLKTSPCQLPPWFAFFGKRVKDFYACALHYSIPVLWQQMIIIYRKICVLMVSVPLSFCYWSVSGIPDIEVQELFWWFLDNTVCILFWSKPACALSNDPVVIFVDCCPICHNLFPSFRHLSTGLFS